MPISKNNTNITAVEFNGNPVATVVHVDRLTKKETIVFGGVLQAPMVNLPYAKTYNTLNFVVKNNDYRQIDKLVVTASAAGYPTRTKEYDTIPGFASTTVYMGTGEGQFLNSEVEYTLLAYAKLGDQQSSTSNAIKSTTSTQNTTLPEIEDSVESSWNYTVYKVINKENGPVTVTTWIEDPINGYKINNTEQSYRIENKDGYKYFAAYFGLANEEKVYAAIANAINEDGKKISLNAVRTFTKPKQEYTDIPTTQSHSYTASTVSVILLNEDESTARLKCRLKNTSNGDIIYPTNDGAGGIFQNLTASGSTYTFNFTVSSATTYIIEKTAISLNLDAPEQERDYQTGSVPFTTKCVVSWYYFNGNTTVLGDTDEVEYNTDISSSYYSGSIPSKPGHTFSRWDVSEFLFSPYTLNVKEDKSIYALFTTNQYTITWYDTQLTSIIKSTTYNYGTIVNGYIKNGTEPIYPSDPEDISTGDGKFYFSSWSTVPPHTVTSNLTINTNWTPYNYAIWYYGLGSDYITKEYTKAQFKAGAAIIYPATDPSDPSNSNYRFNGWNPASAVMPAAGSNKLIYGNWVKQYYVKWYNGSNSTAYKTALVDNGYQVISSDYPTNAAINLSLESVKKFITGWDKAANTTATKVNGADLSITATIADWPYAKWWNGYDYKNDDPVLGEIFMKQEQFAPNSVITGYPDDLTRTGWKWNGWNPAAIFDKSSPPKQIGPIIGTSTQQITAQWIEQVTITWRNYDNTADIGTSTIAKGTSIAAKDTYQTATARTGYTWTGWSTTVSGSLITFPYTANSTITLYATYSVNIWKVKWFTYDGTAIANEDDSYGYGASVPEAAQPSSDTWGTVPKGCVDDGWNTTFPFTMPNKDVSITRQYKTMPAAPSMMISFSDITATSVKVRVATATELAVSLSWSCDGKTGTGTISTSTYYTMGLVKFYYQDISITGLTNTLTKYNDKITFSITSSFTGYSNTSSSSTFQLSIPGVNGFTATGGVKKVTTSYTTNSWYVECQFIKWTNITLVDWPILNAALPSASTITAIAVTANTSYGFRVRNRNKAPSGGVPQGDTGPWSTYMQTTVSLK